METTKRFTVIRYIYLYLVTAITIILIIISAIGLLHLVLKEYVFDVKGWEELEDPKDYWECNDDTLFYTLNDSGKRIKKDFTITKSEMDATKNDCIEKAKKTREAQHLNQIKETLTLFLSMLIVALPLYLYHWGVIKKENKK